MENITGICPHCGMIVEGQRVKSYTNEGTRQDAEADVPIATSIRTVVKCVKIGNEIAGTVGGVVGGALALVGSTIYNQKVNESKDKVGDIVEDESIAMDFEFSCPKCGFTWTRKMTQISNSHLLEDDDDEDDDDVEDDEYDEVEDGDDEVEEFEDELEDEEDNDAFSFHISDIEPDNELVAVSGTVIYGTISKNDIVQMRKADGQVLKATVVKIFDNDYGDFCECVDSESSCCTLFLDGVKAQQIDNNDVIENEMDWQEKFDSVFDSYNNGDFADWEIKNLVHFIGKDARKCTDNFVKAQYYCLMAVIRMKYFYKRWFKNRYKLYSERKFQKFCLVDGLGDIQIARNLYPHDGEYNFIWGIISLMKGFWYDDCYDKAYYEKSFGNLLELVKSDDNFMFSVEWLTEIYTNAYHKILSICSYVTEEPKHSVAEPTATEPSDAEPTAAEKEYMEELREILADGEISPRERRLLDKIRVNLGISESRAKQLEALLSAPSLSPEEQEYLNEYKEIISEGEISARDQRYLDKLKKANGISEQRAKEIEMMVK